MTMQLRTHAPPPWPAGDGALGHGQAARLRAGRPGIFAHGAGPLAWVNEDGPWSRASQCRCHGVAGMGSRRRARGVSSKIDGWDGIWMPVWGGDAVPPSVPCPLVPLCRSSPRYMRACHWLLAFAWQLERNLFRVHGSPDRRSPPSASSPLADKGAPAALHACCQLISAGPSNDSAAPSIPLLGLG